MKRLTCVLALLFTLSASAALAQGVNGDPKKATIVDESEVDPPVTLADLQVVERARRILNSPAVWNRNDDRKCPDDEKTFSLYCAVEVATSEIEGTFKHRGAAMQQARFVVDEVTSKRDYQHRLKDYNNDPTTTFADITHVFDQMEIRIRVKLAAQHENLDRR